MNQVNHVSLMLVQDVFVQLFVLLGEDDVVLGEGEQLRNSAEG